MLDERGFLPEGVHEMTIDQVREHFGTFKSTDARPQLHERLQRLYDCAREVGFVKYLIVDGSYVTAKPDPNDIDIVIVVDPLVLDRQEYRPHEYDVISSRRIRSKYSFDAFVVAENSQALEGYMRLFSRVKGSDSHNKGVVRVAL